jgi:coenzyme F420-0:L-glutamate ligase/coenzyme F420-1:gamma-L-glutamate ligase
VKPPSALRIEAVRWPEVRPGDDLGRMLTDTTTLHDGDVVVITSKVISKATGRVVEGSRAAWTRAETTRVVARRSETVISETSHGLVLAAAGVDASNTPAGTVVLLPTDADAAAAELRTTVAAATGRNIAVIVTDTAGRAWRVGQTDIAIGCAGLLAINDLRGAADTYGRRLDVTMPAIADEIAGAADLVKGKVTGCPLAVVRGLAAAVLPAGTSGAGANALLRATEDDLFGVGARDAVTAAAMRDDDVTLAHFPKLAVDEDLPFEHLATGTDPDLTLLVDRQGSGDQRLWRVQVDVRVTARADTWYAAGQLVERCHAVAAGYRLAAAAAAAESPVRPGWIVADHTVWRVA